eukprot:gene18087-24512_t
MAKALLGESAKVGGRLFFKARATVSSKGGLPAEDGSSIQACVRCGHSMIGGWVLPSNHPALLRAHKQLAQSLKATGEHELASEQYRLVVEGYEGEYGPEHENTAIGILQLAACLLHLGKLEECNQLARRALSINEKALGESAPDTIRVIAFLKSLAKRPILHEPINQLKFRTPKLEGGHLVATFDQGVAILGLNHDTKFVTLGAVHIIFITTAQVTTLPPSLGLTTT